MKKTIYCILGIILFAYTSGKSQENLLKNSGFELGIPVGEFPTNGGGWIPSWYPEQAGAITTSTAAKLPSKAGLWLYTSSGSKSFVRPYQEMRCVGGGVYQAKIYFRTPQVKDWSHDSTAFLTVTFLNNFGRSVSEKSTDTLKVANNTDWHMYSLTARAPQNSCNLRYTINLVSSKVQSILNADDCCLVRIDER